MSLYHLYCLCDFAPIFMHKKDITPSISHISKESTEAVIVAFLNYYAEKNNFPLSLYRSDLHEKGTILSTNTLEKNEEDIKQVRKYINEFIHEDYLTLINTKYKAHIGLNTNINYSTSSIRKTLKSFIDEYVKYIPPNTK